MNIYTVELMSENFSRIDNVIWLHNCIFWYRFDDALISGSIERWTMVNGQYGHTYKRRYQYDYCQFLVTFICNFSIILTSFLPYFATSIYIAYLSWIGERVIDTYQNRRDIHWSMTFLVHSVVSHETSTSSNQTCSKTTPQYSSFTKMIWKIDTIKRKYVLLVGERELSGWISTNRRFS